MTFQSAAERRRIEAFIKGESLDSLYLKVEVLQEIEDRSGEQDDLLEAYKKRIMELESGS